MLGGHTRLECSGQRVNMEDAFSPAPAAWSRARRKLVLKLLKRFDATGPLLDVGCGAGEKWPGFETYGVDISSKAVALAKKNGISAWVGDARSLPFADGFFGVLLMLDVLEHIDDERRALREAHRVLREGGCLIASVPLYPCLWSLHDEAVGHVRRYKPGEVKRLLGEEGFRVVYDTRWNIFGLPGALLRRMGMRIDAASEFFGPVLLAESQLAASISLPFGLSEFCLGIKVKREQ